MASATPENLRRTRSEGSAPGYDTPRAGPVRVRVSRRTGSPVGRAPPTLPPLDLPRGPLMPSLHSAPAARGPPPTWDVPLFDEPRRVPPTHPPPDQNAESEAADGLLGMLMESLGYAGPNAKARRELLSLIFSLTFGFAQVVIIITLLAYSAHHESPTVPGETEWRACERPLGTWNALWLIRVGLGSLLAYWTWRRERAAGIRRARRQNQSDTELATQRYLDGRPHYAQMDHGPTRAPRRQGSRATGLSYEGSRNYNTDSAGNVPQSRLQARVSLCMSFVSLAWFLTAHVLAYTSVNTCRFSAPHLWWLTFGILCILYVMILEIFLLGLLVFILGPVLYLVWNIFLLCLGRHPLQNPHYIKPDIGKLPKSTVQQIPLVLYIPPPPGESTGESPGVTVPPAAHSFPPKSSPTASAATASSTSPAVPKRRFAFFRRKGGAGAAKNKARSSPREGGDGAAEKRGAGAGKQPDSPGAEQDEADEEDVPWDEMWEKGEHPFVRLEGNRAVCAICLMDFEEPRRVRGPGAKAAAAAAVSPTGDEQKSAARGGGADGADAVQEIQVEEVTEEERDALKLDDAGEGPQPLRLLLCGHAFHQTCVDPWLTEVSGRCPTCQRPVEIPQPSKKGKRRQRT
ncbi:hypothetical protein GY45DRAFT_868121 [Cubamyces sp. BRFM 1775]|nr:hypothetical protein GY45DRAFT_868121 [Cubamyces sp. BRFM 1775]